MGLEIINSPYGPCMAIYKTRAGFLQILVVSIPLCVYKGATRHHCRSRMGPVRVP